MLDLEPIKRRAEAATPGPWVDGYVMGFCRKQHGPDEGGPWHGKGFCRYEYAVTECSDARRLASTSALTAVAGNYDCDEGGIIKPEDHAFIAASRTDVPALVAEVEAERAENRRLRAALDAERAACDEWRENQHMHYKGIFGEAPCHDGACPLCVKHDARRAAEQGQL